MTKPIPLVIATRNPGKIREIKTLLSGNAVNIRGLADFGPIPEVEEDGQTFDENAYKKASFTARVLGFPALADKFRAAGPCLGRCTGCAVRPLGRRKRQ